MRSCTNIVGPDQTLNLISVYTISHSFSNTLDISVVSTIIVIKVIECMHAYIHVYIHVWLARTHLPTYRPTDLHTPCVHACAFICMLVCMNSCVQCCLSCTHTCVHFHLCPERAAHPRNLIRVQCAHLRTLIRIFTVRIR